VIYAEQSIVGLMPLATKDICGIRFVRPLLPSWLSPDVMVNDHYRAPCIAMILHFVFTTLHARYLDLVLPAGSPSPQLFHEHNSTAEITARLAPDIRHCVIPVTGSWKNFTKARGSNYRRRFRRLERNLTQAGSWRISQIENPRDAIEAVNKVMTIEQNSWKQEWRSLRNEIDHDLQAVLAGAQSMAQRASNFTWNLWFLDIETQPVAYSLVLHFRDVTYIVKTSYDKRYRRLYPGIYLNNALIQEVFTRQQSTAIDWLTDLDFHRNWTTTCLPRVRVLMASKGLVTSRVGWILASERLKKLRALINDPLVITRAFH
jgi:hypothetical protein